MQITFTKQQKITTVRVFKIVARQVIMSAASSIVNNYNKYRSEYGYR